ncbi:MAG: PilZ domain-containing protein [Methylococcales bacterium]|nr:PilZ domain-containing protein [Methylococcales bacterium]
MDTEEDPDIFAPIDFDQVDNSQRRSVRYIREDLECQVLTQTWYFKTLKFTAKLLDISSRGALLDCPDLPAKTKKLVVRVRFPDQQEFLIQAHVIRFTEPPHQLAVKFDRQEDDFADHLLETEGNLSFR